MIVEGIRPGISANMLRLYFEKPSYGGEVEAIDVFGNSNTARIVFGKKQGTS